VQGLAPGVYQLQVVSGTSQRHVKLVIY
jgi:hypothetical protein